MTTVGHVARWAPFFEVRDFGALQVRELTEAAWATVVRRLGFGWFFLGECLAGAGGTGAGLGVTGVLATGVGAGAGGTGLAAGDGAATGVVSGGAGAGVVPGGVLVGGAGVVVVAPDPLHRPSAQHGSTTRSLLTGIPGPPMIHRFSGE